MKKQQLKKNWLSKKLAMPLLTFMLLLAFSSSGLPKANPPSTNQKVFKDWTLLQENNDKLIDVFYRIVECDTSNYIELRVFNENSIDQTVEFNIDVKNGMNSNKFQKSIKLDVKKGAIVASPCTANSKDNLAIELPKGYDPEKILIVTISFK